ncbi:hypothetical protein [Pararhodonellum marinum]|uniref:hypothetical protein n=1 Tax=Pararhodonellum marinum TaxID=2755358 RepID=UPI00188EE954|nr:hypothetical protein [Pararhodonellum marinum]
MNNLKIRLKRKAFRRNVKISETENTFIRPFRERPCIEDTGQESVARMNPYDLFSSYTADIIRKDVIFTR